MWDDPKNAQTLLKEQTRLSNLLDGFNSLETELSDNIELIEMGEEEGDAETVFEAEKSLSKLASRSKQLETESLFSGDADGNNSYIEIHSGAGGTESCDWALMLLRMYMRWAENHGFKAKIIDENAGEETGIKSATLKVDGLNA